MKYLLIFTLFLTSFSSVYSKIDTIFNHKYSPSYIANHKDKHITCVAGFAEYNEQGKQIKTGEYIIFTSNAGVTWDTLKGWWLPMKYVDSSAILPWEDISFIFYLGEDVLCMMHSDGKLLRYDLKTKKCDTTTLIPPTTYRLKDIKTKFSKYNDNSAIVYHINYDSMLITYNKGIDWTKKRSFRSSPHIPKPYYVANPSLIDDNFNYFSFWRLQSIGYITSPFEPTIGGYLDDEFYLGCFDYDSKKDTLTYRNIGEYFNVGFPKFINDSVAFVSGHKVYFFSDSLLYDSVFNQPVIYKTTNTGRTWEKLYEADSFIGRNHEILYFFGDTIIMPYSTSNKVSLLKSTNLGETWSHKDISHVLQSNDKLIGIDVISTNEYLFALRSNVTDGNLRRYLTLKYTEDYVSVKDDPKVFLPDAKIFPNPAVDYVNIEFEPWLGLPSNVELYDILGNKISAQIYRSEGSVMINTVALSAGTYTVRISTPNGVIAKAFVKGL